MKQFYLLTIMYFMTTWSLVGQERHPLKVVVNNLKSNNGQIGVLIFDRSEGYPNNPDLAVAQKFVSAMRGVEIVFDDIAYGSYVITIMHDENNNGQMDQDFFGRPKEGHGVSNDPPNSTFGPPRYASGLIKYDAQNHKASIRMRYD